MEYPRTIQSLTTLPFEIQYTIAGFLTARDSWQCSAVNRSWRSLFLSNDCVWENLSTKDKHRIVPELLLYRQYIRNSAVKSLYVDAEESKVQEIIEFLDSIPCRSVSRVYMKAWRLSSNAFLGFMNNSSTSLTYMDINLYFAGASNVTPDIILRHCPNLKGLYYIGSIDDTQKSNGLWRPRLDFKHQNIVKLLLDYKRSFRGDFDIRPFLEAMPKLRKLSIAFEDVENSAFPTDDLQQCAPELTELDLFHTDSDYPVENIDRRPLCGEGEGLEWLSVTVYDSSPAIQTLIQNLARTQHRSLCYLEFDGEESLSLPLLLSVSSNVFEGLVRLTLSNASEGDPLALCAILLRSCPELMYLGLHNVEFANDDVLSACLGPDCLQELDIWDCPQITSTALTNVLTWMGRHGYIYHLSLDCMDAVTSTVMEAIAGLDSLQYLCLDKCNSLTAADFERFLDTTKSKRKFTNITFTTTVQDLGTVPDSKVGQRILQKLDAKAEKWKFGLYVPLRLRKDFPDLADCSNVSITHKEYRYDSNE